MEELQVENGNYTRIVNPLIENLVKIPFKGCELAVALFIIRKTYGYNKTQDEISLSQFCIGLNRSKQTIVTALHNLQLVKVARLVKRGTSKKSSNCWRINKYHDTWELVNMARLVQRKRGTSLTEALKLVQTARHTKDNTKYNTKDILSDKSDLGSIQIKNESYMLEELTYEPEGVKTTKSKLGSKTMAYLAHIYLETHDIKIATGQTYNANKLAKGLSELYQECGKDVDECARRLRVGAAYFKARNLEWNPNTIWKNWEIITKSSSPKSASEVRILN